MIYLRYLYTLCSATTPMTSRLGSPALVVHFMPAYCPSGSRSGEFTADSLPEHTAPGDHLSHPYQSAVLAWPSFLSLLRTRSKEMSVLYRDKEL